MALSIMLGNTGSGLLWGRVIESSDHMWSKISTHLASSTSNHRAVRVASTAPKTSRTIPASQKALTSREAVVELSEKDIDSIWACKPAKNVACARFDLRPYKRVDGLNTHHNSEASETFHSNLTVVSPLRDCRGIIGYTVEAFSISTCLMIKKEFTQKCGSIRVF